MAASTSGGQPDYVQGSIVRIQLKNFMTYETLDFRPGPRMNVIIGPNGTGKSTIMCAICLGLGGKASLIGRATQLRDFVKIGQETAHILIELAVDGRRNCEISCTITKSAFFTLNGKAAKLNEIKETVAGYDIQMDNLCQFLPQDRVVEFVKMTPQELLENTEKAAGNAGMFEDHCKLKDWHSKSSDLVVACSRLKDDLERESQRRLRFEEQVKNYHDRNAFLEKVNVLERKKCWIKYEEKRSQYLAVKNEKIQAEAKFKLLSDDLEPMSRRMHDLTKNIKDCDEQLTKLIGDIKRQKAHVSGKYNDLEKEDEKAKEITDHYNETVKMEDSRLKRLHEMKQQLQYFESELAKLVDTEEDAKKELIEVQEQMQTVLNNIGRSQEKTSNISVDIKNMERDLETVNRDLKRIQNVDQQRLESLRQKDKHAYDAVVWLRANKDKFKKTIYEPIMMMINVQDPKYVKYVENTIAFKDMVAFVCEDADDLELFMSTLSDQQNLRINVVLAPRDCNPLSYPSSVPIDMIRQYGFQCYLNQTFTAPQAVLGYLCKQFNFHKIPIGNEETNQRIEEVLNNTRFTRFFTANHQYNVRMSSYGNRSRSTRASEVPPSRLLTFNQDMSMANTLKERANELRAQLDQARADLREVEQNERELVGTLEQLRKKKKELLTKREYKKNLHVKVEQKQESIRNCQEETIDIDAEKANGRKQLELSSYRKLEILKAQFTLTHKLVELAKERVFKSFRLKTIMIRKGLFMKEFSESQTMLANLKKNSTSLGMRVTEAQEEAKQYLQKAKKKMGAMTEEELNESIDQMNMPDQSLETIETMIISLTAQAQSMTKIDKSVLRDYEEWKMRIEKLDQSVSNRSEALANHREEMEIIIRRWLPPLEKLIGEINLRFARYFASLKCAGEVSLSKGDSDNDYSKYGICIKVKYRATDQLRELTSQYQSGGEKSVATILYLLAMQEFIKLPFCCVDEINQGMDSTNERRVFNMMTQTVCKGSRCQYFLVTPKLLADLEFGPDITIHCIHRGSVEAKQEDWSIDKFLQLQAAYD